MKVYKNKKIIILYLAPVVIGLATFVYYPLIRSWLTAYINGFLILLKERVGFDNYIQIFTDENFMTILKNNILYAAFSVLCQVVIAMVLAACLEEIFMRRFQKFFRTVLFLPSLISMSVLGILWKCIFNPNSGLLNAFIHSIGFEHTTPMWLGDASLAIFCCIFVSQGNISGIVCFLI